MLRFHDRLRIALLSGKGGCGRSTIAINLAYLLAAAGRRVVLVDLAQFGSLTLLLHLAPRPGTGISSVAACLASEHRQELANLIEGALLPVPTNASGQLFLLAAAPPQRQDDLEVAHWVEVLRTLSTRGYDLVIDTSHDLSDRLVASLHAATHRLWVVTPDPAAGYHTTQSLAIARELAVPPAPSGMLVNRYHRRSGLRLPDLEGAVGLPIWGVLPDVPGRLPLASHQGVPIMVHRFGPWRGALLRMLNQAGDPRRTSFWPRPGRGSHGQV